MRAHIGAAVLAGALLASVTARADAIDGAWCHEGLRLTISGPAIVTPGGTKTSGDYSRHAFSYVVPDSEPQPGSTITMRLLNEETMHLRTGPDAQWETWRRCGPPIS